MKRKAITLAVALLLGALAAVAAATYLTGERQEIDDGMKPVEVLVAQDTLPAGLSASEMADRGLVQKERVPQRYVAKGAISSVIEAQGQVLAATVAKGEQLPLTRFQYPSDAGLAFSTPSDKVAVTIPADEIKAVAGLLKAGDRVVVVATFSKEVAGRDVTRVLLPGVSVLAVDQSVGAEPEKTTVARTGDALASTSNRTSDRRNDIRSITLALSAPDVAKLVFAEEKGKLWLALLPRAHPRMNRGAAETVKSVLK